MIGHVPNIECMFSFVCGRARKIVKCGAQSIQNRHAAVGMSQNLASLFVDQLGAFHWARTAHRTIRSTARWTSSWGS